MCPFRNITNVEVGYVCGLSTGYFPASVGVTSRNNIALYMRKNTLAAQGRES